MTKFQKLKAQIAYRLEVAKNAVFVAAIKTLARLFGRNV